MPACDHGKGFHGLSTFEHPCQPVIVFGREWIEFVIVAAGAAHGQPHHRSGDGVDLFVDDIHLHFDRVILGQHFGTQA